MAEVVSCKVVAGIAIITVDNPPVNAIGQAVRRGLIEALAAAEADHEVKAVVVCGAGRTFIAGADIREFGKPPQPPLLPEVMAAFDSSPKPVTCVYHGTALGGGFELGLACTFRVAVAGAKLGLPEVNLGIIPGAGGTQRLPRLIGADRALEIITSARQIAAQEALELGIVDAIATDSDPAAAGIAFARKALAENRPLRPVSALEDKIAADRANPELFSRWRETLKKKARGRTAPLRAIDAVEAAVILPFEEGVKREREIYLECQASPQREGLVHAFFADREVTKIPGLEGVSPRIVERVGVIGGGTMGAGITVALLTSGLPVAMIERDEDSLARGRANVERILAGNVASGRMREDEKDRILAERFSGSTDYAACAEVDLVIEAAFEDMEVKTEIFRTLDAVAKPGAVLATNTSYLDIDEIAAVTSRPQDVIGLHFFSPAHIMKLLEIVVADKTAPELTATGFALAKRLRKVGVRAGVCDGFIGNRILAAYRKQADYLMADGASPYEIDAAIRAFGFPMGPYQVADLAGLDIGWATRKRLAPTRDPRERYVAIGDRICERGWYGQKTGRGFYLYPDGARAGTPDPEVDAIIAEERESAGITPRRFSEDEIIRRYLAAMINEGAKVVEDGIALRPLDVDVVLLYGYGFPRYRGGPMKYADMVGLDRVLADIRAFAEEDGFFWQPSQLLIELAQSGRKFDDLNRRDRNSS